MDEMKAKYLQAKKAYKKEKDGVILQIDGGELISAITLHIFNL